MKKCHYIIFLILLAVAIIILSARFLSGEDDWICQNGQWVRHGNPSVEKPTISCEK